MIKKLKELFKSKLKGFIPNMDAPTIEKELIILDIVRYRKCLLLYIDDKGQLKYFANRFTKFELPVITRISEQMFFEQLEPKQREAPPDLSYIA